MHFLSDKSSQYESVDSNDDTSDSSCERATPRKRERFSRLALLAIIIVTQALVLASTNAAAYAFGKMRAEKSTEMTAHMTNNNALADSTSTCANHDPNTTSL